VKESVLISQAMEAGRQHLANSIGEVLHSISILSEDPTEAVFLANNVSKLSPIIGNLIERRIPGILKSVDNGGLIWRRQDPGFPDAGLFDAKGTFLNAGFEVKAWFPLSTEMTGRFKESQNLLRGKEIDIVVVAWMLSDVVFGTPEVIDILIVPALEVAESRDYKYHNPPDYLCEEPQETSQRTRNLQQTNVSGYKLQEKSAVERLSAIYAEPIAKKAPSCTQEGIDLTSRLQSEAKYRLDTNFAKLARVGSTPISEFTMKVLDLKFKGATIDTWREVFQSVDDKKGIAEIPTLLQNLYKSN
jgi:hypothetical protein